MTRRITSSLMVFVQSTNNRLKHICFRFEDLRHKQSEVANELRKKFCQNDIAADACSYGRNRLSQQRQCARRTPQENQE